ncbi:MAG: tryptophan synthase subunit alpha [Fimbriimonadaceae bacterium]|nr:tryptophan synthase subunit alpha [Fimbriimonadaceae bacterium]QYK55330.1 MAG: tryptophan synthase subunit alpha [Fimbriimonadaceae bacterium]
MPRISETFEELRRRGEKALVLFVTAGDPSLDQLPAILDALAEGGADAIEVGLPFSDPIADGPTIQAASQRALDRGTRMADVFAALRGFDRVPVVLMGYMNPIMRIGAERFATEASLAGVAGTILCDAIPEEATGWIETSRSHGLDNIFLCAPTSTEGRIEAACKAATGFVYAVSRTGVTGAGQEAPPEVRELVGRIRTHTDLPVCVGFGISRPDHVRMVCSVADGAVVGSWLVDLLADRWEDGRGRDEVVAAVRALKDATKDSS